jgi:hypothetical protein
MEVVFIFICKAVLGSNKKEGQRAFSTNKYGGRRFFSTKKGVEDFFSKI